MKILFHSNAPWSPSGYGRQVALFAPRLARHAELAISAFHGLQGARIRWNELDVYPALGGTYGNECILGHAESFFGSLRGGLVLTLLDVPALDAATWSRLNVACWVPVDHDPAPPRRPELLRADGGDPDRDVAVRPGAAERRRRALRPARSRHRGLLAAAAGRGAASASACRRARSSSGPSR